MDEATAVAETVYNGITVGDYVKLVFDYTESFSVFGIPFTYWILIFMVIIGVSYIIRGNKA